MINRIAFYILSTWLAFMPTGVLLTSVSAQSVMFPGPGYGGLSVTATYQASTTSGSSGTTSFTLTSQTFGTAFAGRIIVIAVTGRHPGTTGALTAATIGGVSAYISATVENSTSGNTTSLAFASAVVPTGTTGTVALTFSTNCNNPVIGIYSVENAASATPSFTASAGTNTSPLVPSGGINVPLNGTLIGAGYNGAGGGNVSSFAGVSLDNNTSNLGTGHTNYVAAQTALAVSATFANSPSDTAVIFGSWGP